MCKTRRRAAVYAPARPRACPDWIAPGPAAHRAYRVAAGANDRIFESMMSLCLDLEQRTGGTFGP